MTSGILHKIEAKADSLRLQASLKYKGADDCVPYKETIVSNDKYPDFFFLVTENMVFKSNFLKDSCYEVFSFNADGDYVRKEDVAELGKSFFTTMKEIKTLG